MPAVARHREKDERSWISGTYQQLPGAPYTYWAQVGNDRVMDDTVGGFPAPQALDARLQRRLVTRLHGTQLATNGSVFRIWNGVPCTPGSRAAPDPRVKWAKPTLLDLNNYAWKVLAQTNPNVPHVDVPTELGELRDIPRALQGWGQTWISRVAAGYITWRWMVKPMWSTLKKLNVDFPTAFEKRREELRRIFEGQTIRKRTGLGSEHETLAFSAPYSIHTSTAIVNAKDRVTRSLQVWGTVKWKLDPTWTVPPAILVSIPEEVKKYGEFLTGHISLDGDGRLRAKKSFKRYVHENSAYISKLDFRLRTAKVQRATQYDHYSKGSVYSGFDELAEDLHYGRNTHAVLSALWELTPWSWFTDWFVGIGDTIAATNNTIPLTWSDICVMRTLVAKREYVFTGVPSVITLKGEHSEMMVRKERHLAYPILPFSVSIPWLTAGQWSILGALATLKLSSGPRSPGRKRWENLPGL